MTDNITVTVVETTNSFSTTVVEGIGDASVDGSTYGRKDAGWTSLTKEIGIACSDETTDLETGVSKATFRMPLAMTLIEVRSNVNTAPVGSEIIVDINKWGTSILSTKLTIDVGEETSTTAAISAVISDSELNDDDEITVDIDQKGSATAGTGLKIWLIGEAT